MKTSNLWKPGSRALSLAGLMIVSACAGSRASSPPAAAPASAAAAAPQPSAADLRGDWVEYWAVSGGVDTEGYSFTEDGHFVWRAAKKDQAPNSAVQRAGSYRVERAGQAPQLVLQVDSERFAPCAAPCTSDREEREVRHATPLTEAHEIGECPANREAERLDASYECRAFGGKAFWRVVGERAQHAAAAQRG